MNFTEGPFSVYESLLTTCRVGKKDTSIMLDAFLKRRCTRFRDVNGNAHKKKKRRKNVRLLLALCCRFVLFFFVSIPPFSLIPLATSPPAVHQVRFSIASGKHPQAQQPRAKKKPAHSAVHNTQPQTHTCCVAVGCRARHGQPFSHPCSAA